MRNAAVKHIIASVFFLLIFVTVQRTSTLKNTAVAII